MADLDHANLLVQICVNEGGDSSIYAVLTVNKMRSENLSELLVCLIR